MSTRANIDVNTLLDDLDIPPTQKTGWLKVILAIMISLKKIATIVRDDNDGGNEDEDEVYPLAVTHAKALETVLTYHEQHPEMPMSTTVLHNGLLIETARRRAMDQKRTKMNNYFSRV